MIQSQQMKESSALKEAFRDSRNLRVVSAMADVSPSLTNLVTQEEFDRRVESLKKRCSSSGLFNARTQHLMVTLANPFVRSSQPNETTPQSQQSIGTKKFSLPSFNCGSKPPLVSVTPAQMFESNENLPKKKVKIKNPEKTPEATKKPLDLPQVAQVTAESHAEKVFMSKTINGNFGSFVQQSPLRNKSIQLLQASSQTVDEYGLKTVDSRRNQNGVKTETGWFTSDHFQDVTPQVRSHVHSLIRADQSHDKSQKLFLYLKKQAQKQMTAVHKETRYESRSKQRQKMQAAMDSSVKVGPVTVPHKLIVEERLRKGTKKEGRVTQSQPRSLKLSGQPRSGRSSLRKSVGNASSALEPLNFKLQAESSASQASHEENTSDKSPLGFRSAARREKQEGGQSHDKQAFDFSKAIFSMLEKSLNYKQNVKRQELDEQMETEMRLTGFKLKERVNRVINKVFEKEIELEDIFMVRANDSDQDEKENRPSSSKILANAMVSINDLCQACADLTTRNEPLPLLDQIEASDEETPWRDTRQKRALKEIKKWIERQKTLIRQMDPALTLEETPLLDFDERPFEDENKKVKDRHLARVVTEKFGTDGHNKVELKTCSVLFDEVLRQVRVWSGKHADVIEGLWHKQKALSNENHRLIQKKARLVRDKLAKTVVSLTTQLEKTLQKLAEKLRLIDQSLKAQQLMDQNLTKAYELFHFANKRQKEQEGELEYLRMFVLKWLPNFQKYGFHESFKDGIRYLTEDKVLTEQEQQNFWRQQDVAHFFDGDDNMWGLSPRSTLDSIKFNGRTLRTKYSRPELWLRSDVVRLTKVFNIATPDRVELESIRAKFNVVQWKNNQMDDVIATQQKELRVRWKQVEQLKKLELDLLHEQSKLLSENTRMQGILEVAKFDKGAQVELISSQMHGKLSKMDRKILAQHRREQQMVKQKTAQNPRRKGRLELNEADKLETLPTFDNQPRIDALESILAQYAQEKNPRQKQQLAVMQANHWLQRLHEIDFKSLMHLMEQRVIRKNLAARRRHNYKVELEPRYTQLGQFYSQLILQYPFNQSSAWKVLVDCIEDNANDLMQSLHDLYSLGEEDWRFLLVQYVCGIFYNKTEDRKQINACLVDKFESAPANLVSIILINAQIDTDTVFSQQVDPETLLSLDVVVQSISKGIRNIFKTHRIFMELIYPQVMVLAYQRLLNDIEVIEAVSNETENLERQIYYLDVRGVSESARTQVELFNQIVIQINRVGLADLLPDVSQDSDEISVEGFMKFVSEKLKVEIPEAYQKPIIFARFVQHRILNFKSHSVDMEAQMEPFEEQVGEDAGARIKLTKKDLQSLEHIVIHKKVPLRKALMTAVATAYSLIRIKQSFFEPIFNRYADRLTIGSLNLEGTFYQSLLFVAKSNISNIFLDNLSQNTATLQINERARNLITNLKKIKAIQQISLPKFTNICLELDLLEYVPATLKRLGRSQLLRLPSAMHRCSDLLQEINPAFPKANQVFHYQATMKLKNNELNKVLNQSSKQFFMGMRYCAMLLRSKFFSSVFDLNDEDRIAQSFNIFIDSELAELNQMMIIASLKDKKQLPQKKQQQQVQVQRRSQYHHSPTQQQRMSELGSPKLGMKSSRHFRMTQQFSRSPQIAPRSKSVIQPEQYSPPQTVKAARNRIQGVEPFALPKFIQQRSPSEYEDLNRSEGNSSVYLNKLGVEADNSSGLNFSESKAGAGDSGTFGHSKFKGIFPQPMTKATPTKIQNFRQSVPKNDGRTDSDSQAHASIAEANLETGGSQIVHTLQISSELSIIREDQDGQGRSAKKPESVIEQPPSDEIVVVEQSATKEAAPFEDRKEDSEVKFQVADFEISASLIVEESPIVLNKEPEQLKATPKRMSVPINANRSMSRSGQLPRALIKRNSDESKSSTQRDLLTAGARSVTQGTKSSNFSQRSLHPMQQPVVEVSRKTKKGFSQNLLNDRDYQSKKDGCPPLGVVKHQAALERHKQRLKKAQMQREALYKSHTQQKKPESPQDAQINSDLENLDSLALNDSQRSAAKNSKQQTSNAVKRETSKKEAADWRSNTMPSFATFSELRKGKLGEPKPCDILSKVNVHVSKVSLAAPKTGSRSPARSRAGSSRSRQKLENKNKPQFLSKQGETKIKLLKTYKRSHLQDGTIQQLVQRQKKSNLMLIGEQRANKSQTEPRNEAR